MSNCFKLCFEWSLILFVGLNAIMCKSEDKKTSKQAHSKPTVSKQYTSQGGGSNQSTTGSPVLAQGGGMDDYFGAGSAAIGDQVDVFSMTRDELMQLTPSELDGHLEQLEQQYEEEQQILIGLQEVNTTLCNKLEQLTQKCAALHPMMGETEETGLGCQGEGSQSSSSSIEVEIRGANGLSFRLEANDKYISSIFSEGRSPITFQKKKGRALTKAPRFNEITTLSLVSVGQNSKITNTGVVTKKQPIDDRASMISSMGFLIYVNDQKLIQPQEGSGLTLSVPEDPELLSEIRIAPEQILEMGRSDNCMVDLEEIKRLTQGQ